MVERTIQKRSATSYATRILEGRIRDSAKDLLAKHEDEFPQEAYTAAMEQDQVPELDEVTADLVDPKRRNKFHCVRVADLSDYNGSQTPIFFSIALW